MSFDRHISLVMLKFVVLTSLLAFTAGQAILRLSPALPGNPLPGEELVIELGPGGGVGPAYPKSSNGFGGSGPSKPKSLGGFGGSSKPSGSFGGGPAKPKPSNGFGGSQSKPKPLGGLGRSSKPFGSFGGSVKPKASNGFGGSAPSKPTPLNGLGGSSSKPAGGSTSFGGGSNGNGKEQSEKPMPYSFAFESQDEEGTKITRQEQGNEQGIVTGTYSFSANGLERVVTYIADENGFHDVVVKTNEPGNILA